MDFLLNQGLEEHASAKLSTPVEYNYQPLTLRISTSSASSEPETAGTTSTFKSGLVGHSGGSFMMIESIHVEPHVGLEDTCALLLQEAERIARDERSCTRIVLHAFDFETALLAASASLGYELIHELPAWFGGRVVRDFLSKTL